MQRNSIRAFLLVLLASICLILDTNTAYAQAAQCARLENALRQFDQNADFQRLGGNSPAARQAARNVQTMESRYIRNGCNDAARAGRPLTPQCQQIGREVLRLRDVAAQITRQVETANAIAGQREAILQEMARFGCSIQRSSSSLSNSRQNIFNRVFGTTTEGDFSGGQMIDDNGFWGNQSYQTIRTVCVRLSDGYFWPVSYSTLSEYLNQDEQVCQASCPTTPVALYFYDNPGQEPEQMRNIYGEPYTALNTAFLYRTALDTSPSASCKVAPQSDGRMITAMTESGVERQMLDVGGEILPLPLRDPRGIIPVSAPLEASPERVTLADIPLPRKRPAAPGKTSITRPHQDTQLRLVQFGDRIVRVVGPDTPYAQSVEEGS